MKANRFISLTNLGLFTLLTFAIIFDGRLVIPPVLQVAGRLHPVLLHLPIGLTFFIGFAFLFLKDLKIQNLLSPLFLLLSITANLSAIAGLFLSGEGNYGDDTLYWHKWLAYVLCVVCYFGSIHFANGVKSLFYNYFLVIGICILTILTGHFGGTITHGEDFLWEPLQKEKEVSITRFEQEIMPILKDKCSSCHNNRKEKGELSFADTERILKGGKSGLLWVGGDTLTSLILERVHLPLEEKKHMPPKNKPQLNEEEVAILKRWISDGADMNEISTFVAEKSKKSYEFNPASPNELTTLQSPFYSILPVSQHSPGLEVRFLIGSAFESADLLKMKSIEEQVVSLNLSRMPVSDKIFDKISNFENLERLNLHGTDIIGEGIEQLLNCEQLETLILSNTMIVPENLEKLITHPSLKHVFLWNTAINQSMANGFLKKNEHWNIDLGSREIFNEVIALNPPEIENLNNSGGREIKLKHVINGVEIRYTMDGSEPDSIYSEKYEKPIPAQEYMTVKAKAFKEGWIASETIERNFFTSTIKATSIEIFDKPNQKIKKSDAEKLIDLKPGDVEDFNDVTWVKFRKQPYEIILGGFERKPERMTISYLINVESYIVHPEKVEIWLGDKSGNYKMIRNFKPTIVKPGEKRRITGIDVDLSNEHFEFLKILVTPLMTLPDWHPGKGDRGWFFIDEIYFY